MWSLVLGSVWFFDPSDLSRTRPVFTRVKGNAVYRRIFRWPFSFFLINRQHLYRLEVVFWLNRFLTEPFWLNRWPKRFFRLASRVKSTLLHIYPVSTLSLYCYMLIVFNWIILRWGFLIWELIFIYCGLFVLILVGFLCVLFLLSQRFGQISPLAFFRWFLPRPRIGMMSLVTVFPVITVFYMLVWLVKFSPLSQRLLSSDRPEQHIWVKF